MDLAEPVLELLSHGISRPSAFDWLEAPPPPKLPIAPDACVETADVACA